MMRTSNPGTLRKEKVWQVKRPGSAGMNASWRAGLKKVGRPQPALTVE